MYLDYRQHVGSPEGPAPHWNRSDLYLSQQGQCLTASKLRLGRPKLFTLVAWR